MEEHAGQSGIHAFTVQHKINLTAFQREEGESPLTETIWNSYKHFLP